MKLFCVLLRTGGLSLKVHKLFIYFLKEAKKIQWKGFDFNASKSLSFHLKILHNKGRFNFLDRIWESRNSQDFWTKLSLNLVVSVTSCSKCLKMSLILLRALTKLETECFHGSGLRWFASFNNLNQTPSKLKSLLHQPEWGWLSLGDATVLPWSSLHECWNLKPDVIPF